MCTFLFWYLIRIFLKKEIIILPVPALKFYQLDMHYYHEYGINYGILLYLTIFMVILFIGILKRGNLFSITCQELHLCKLICDL